MLSMNLNRSWMDYAGRTMNFSSIPWLSIIFFKKRNLPSSMRPESLSPDISLPSSRWPCDNSCVMINPAPCPHIYLCPLPERIHHCQSLLIGIQWHSISSDRLAKFSCFLGCKLVASITFVKKCDDITSALIVMVRFSQGTVEFRAGYYWSS